MKRISLLTVAIALGTTACHDYPTRPELRRPSLIAVSGDAAIPAPVLYYVLANGELTLTWTWGDDRSWDLVSFDLAITGEKVEGNWNIKPYEPNDDEIYETLTFTWSGRDFGQTVPPVCVSVMAKNRSGKGTPTTTYHAENCDPVTKPVVGNPPPLLPETITAGAAFVCGLSVSGEAYCWGNNSFGQLGDGTTTNRSAFWPVAGGLTFTQISAYGWEPNWYTVVGHACALTSSGSAYCWGHNGNGQLGDGTTVDRHVPTAVAGGLQFAQIDVGLAYTCGVTITGDGYCWGQNALGQLGDGTTSGTGRPTPHPVSGGHKFVQVSAGGREILTQEMHTCGVTTSGAAYCWGSNSNGQIGNGSYPFPGSEFFPSPSLVSGSLTFRQISAGGEHTCGVTTSGAAYCWGHGSRGQLGIGSFVTPVLNPAAVAGGYTFVRISAGQGHTCGLTSSGMAYCWGNNNDGESGIGSIYQTAVPTAVLGGRSYTKISAGYRYSCAVTPTGAAYCWGGSPSRTPATPGFGQLSAGDHHACALSPVGEAYCWGSNVRGQLGDGTSSNRTAGEIVDGFAFTQISSGFQHTCGLTATGSAYCWGDNVSGQLGDGTTTDRFLPMPVGGVVAFSRIEPGGEHTCGLTSSGSVYCWGRNNHGQLGDGTTTARLFPTAVAGGYAFQQIAAGTAHTCALTASGQAYCWGSDGVIDYHVPAPVPGGLAFTQLATGDRFTCGLTGSGTAYCWGVNIDGQLGDGTTINKPFPTAVLGGLAFTQISAGSSHACAVTAAGATHCWGWNYYGQLGDGTTTSRLAPTLVLGGLAFEKVSAGGYFTCGADALGFSYCWGANGLGELGDGTTTARSTPSAKVIVWLTFRS